MRKVLASVVLLALAGCGGGSTSPTPVVPTPPPVPSASITATGSGSLVLHPSAVRAFAVALETPIRITESSGGSADWGFARMSIYNRGREIERTELTANDIQRGGAGRIEARSNQVRRVLFRFNTTDFDRIEITLPEAIELIIAKQKAEAEKLRFSPILMAMDEWIRARSLPKTWFCPTV